jgi:hypothetical protein
MIAAFPQRGYWEHAVQTAPVSEAQSADAAPRFITLEQRYFVSSQFEQLGQQADDQIISAIAAIPIANIAALIARSNLVGTSLIFHAPV